MVTAANSLIDALVKKNPEEYKGCVALAVSRLSRVRLYLLFTIVCRVLNRPERRIHYNIIQGPLITDGRNSS